MIPSCTIFWERVTTGFGIIVVLLFSEQRALRSVTGRNKVYFIDPSCTEHLKRFHYEHLSDGRRDIKKAEPVQGARDVPGTGAHDLERGGATARAAASASSRRALRPRAGRRAGSFAAIAVKGIDRSDPQPRRVRHGVR